MLLPPDVIDKIKRERERENNIRIPQQPEISPSKDRLENPQEKRRRKRPVTLIIDLA